MATIKQAIEYFNHRISDLMNSSYLLADKKITDLLKTVTTSKLFYELISYCAEGFDYQSYFEQLPEGSNFPTDNKKHLIAFAFSLLLSIDNKEQDLLNLLSTYYPSDSFENSYKLFVNNFLAPFKDITLIVANEMASSTQTPANTVKTTVVTLPMSNGQTSNASSPKIEEAPKGEGHSKKYLTCYKDIQKILISEKGKIIHSKHLKEEEKNDLIVLLNNFKDCLFLGKKEQIKTSFVSYKYAILAFKKIDSEVEDIERILKFCSAI